MLTNWLICASNLSMDWVTKFWVWIMSSIIFSKSISSSWKGKYEGWFWKFCLNYESIRFWNYYLDSSKISILFFKSTDFSFYWGWTWKGEYESWKFYVNWESTMSWNYRLDSCKATKLFSNLNFSSVGYSWKGYVKQNCRKIVDMVA